MFQEIVEAYESLSDPERRRRFDLLGRADSIQQAAVSALPAPTGSSFIDLLANYLKPKPSSKDFWATHMLGADIETEVTVQLEETVAPITKLINIQTPTPCTQCDGSVWLHDRPASTCPTCDGTGTKKIGPIRYLRPCKKM